MKMIQLVTLASSIFWAGYTHAEMAPISNFRLVYDVVDFSATFSSSAIPVGEAILNTGAISVSLDSSYAGNGNINVIDFSDGSEVVDIHVLVDSPLFQSLGWGAQKLHIIEARPSGSITVSPGLIDTKSPTTITISFSGDLQGTGTFESGQALSGWSYSNWLGFGEKEKTVTPQPEKNPPRPIDLHDQERMIRENGELFGAKLITPGGVSFVSLGRADVSVTLATPVPEPESYVLAAFGLGVLGWAASSRRGQRTPLLAR